MTGGVLPLVKFFHRFGWGGSMVYVIESGRGYWLSGGNGYTSDKDKAGHFAAAELVRFNLDGCTLHLVYVGGDFSPR